MKRRPKFRIPEKKCKRTIEPKEAFDRRSFRWVKSGEGRILIGCPKGKWDARSESCRVGTRAHEVVVAQKSGHCRVDYTKVRKAASRA